VRKRNVGDTVMTSFAITCLISVLWLFFTYSLAFREGGEIFGTDMGWFIGGLDRAGLQGILSDIANNKGNPNSLAPTIPESVYSMFQLTFAIITAALIAGSFAERMKFSAMLWFIGLWAIFVYSPIAHWVWGPDGMFNWSNPHAYLNVLDFAGGTVVHVNSGTAGLMAALMLGKRTDTGRHGHAGHPHRHRDRGFHLDDRRVDHEGQADRARHLLGRRGGSGSYYAGLRVRWSDGLVLYWHRGWRRVLLGLHRPQGHVRLR
jgi:ammonia channel protein AmtB